jgi:hypothetical protein
MESYQTWLGEGPELVILCMLDSYLQDHKVN